MSDPATLLVADDDPGLRESLERALSREGYRVVLASDGRAALERVQTGGIDLIVTDLKMPGLTGLELLRQAGRFRGAVVSAAQAEIILGETGIRVRAR